MRDDRTSRLLVQLKGQLEQQHAEHQLEIKKIVRSLHVIDSCALTLMVMGLFAWVAYLSHFLGWT